MNGDTRAENKITKSMLKSMHERQLMNDESNNIHKEEIISTLGGIDEILSHLFESNVNFSHKQLQSLHNIMTHSENNKQTNMINKTTKNIEDERYDSNERRLKLELTFCNDNAILLHKIFNKKQTVNIINILNNEITKIVLTTMVFIMVFLNVLSVSTDVYFAYESFMFLTFSIYFFGCILYSNKKSMNLLLKQFEFWLTLFFLMVHLMTNAALRYVQGYPSHNICTFFLFSATILFLVMIFSATKNRTIISCVALILFSQSTLFFSNIAFYGINSDNTIYDQLIVTIPYLFGVGTTCDITHIFINSTQILAIFLFKQMVSLVRRVHKFESRINESTNEKIQERNNCKYVNEVEIYNDDIRTVNKHIL